MESVNFKKNREQGASPLHPEKNNQMTQMTKSITVVSMSASHTPHIEVIALIAAIHAAIVEVHTPRNAGSAGAGSRRPVGGRLHIDERMACGQGRVGVIIVH
jgi:hypothetical protein